MFGFMENQMEILKLITIDEVCSFVKSIAVGDQKVYTNSLVSLNIRCKLFGTPTAAAKSPVRVSGAFPVL
jgi:hypothetical protein